MLGLKSHAFATADWLVLSYKEFIRANVVDVMMQVTAAGDEISAPV